MSYFVEFDLWRLRWSHWRILCHCSQSKRFLVPLAELIISLCGPPVVSRNWRTNGKSGCWPIFLSETTSGSRFRHWLFRTWLPAYPCGPVPHYAAGRHLGPPVEATYVSGYMCQLTDASQITTATSAVPELERVWAHRLRQGHSKQSTQHKHIHSASREKKPTTTCITIYPHYCT